MSSFKLSRGRVLFCSHVPILSLFVGERKIKALNLTSTGKCMKYMRGKNMWVMLNAEKTCENLHLDTFMLCIRILSLYCIWYLRICKCCLREVSNGYKYPNSHIDKSPFKGSEYEEFAFSDISDFASLTQHNTY